MELREIHELNKITRNLSKDNSIESICQLVSIIQICFKAGIKFTYYPNYENS